jgi:hypothetical protein
VICLLLPRTPALMLPSANSIKCIYKAPQHELLLAPSVAQPWWPSNQHFKLHWCRELPVRCSQAGPVSCHPSDGGDVHATVHICLVWLFIWGMTGVLQPHV